EFEHFFSVGDANATKDFVATGQIDDAAGDYGCCVDKVVGGELPQELAIPRGEAVQVAVVGADQNPVACDYRRRLDLRLGLERPERRAVRRADSMEQPREVADINHAVVNGR